MGGKALSKYGIQTERISTKDFIKISTEISRKVEEVLGIDTYVTEYFREKESHGDLDLLLKIDHKFHNKGINLKNFIDETFHPKAIHNNGGVYSFDYENFQVDFIPVKESNWETAKDFFSFDPSGNLIGKTSHKFGLKYGWDGLVFPFRNFNGKLSQNILISKDIDRIYEFLGYDRERYKQGFDNKIQIFEWTINSKYFDSEMFKFENLKHVDRKRNKKRATYNEFLQYLEDNKIEKTYSFKRKSEYIATIDEFFPESNLIYKLDELKRKDEENKKMANTFNGHHIMEMFPDLKGKELGNAITEYKKSKEDYRQWILSNTTESVKEDFKKFMRF